MTRSAPPVRKAIRVLLVEDALDQAHLMQFLLEASGNFQVTVAQDGIRGAALAQKGGWDLVISDINLPGADGLEVMKASRSSHPGTPVLATTSYEDPMYARRALASGADDFLLKPIEKSDLLQRVRTLLARKPTAAAPAIDPPRPGHVLAVGVRPGDVEAGIGGTLIAHKARGDTVVILTLGGKDGAPTQIADRAKRAGRRIGARLVSGNLVLGEENSEAEMVRLVRAVVHELRPEIVYVHSSHDRMEEKRQSHRAALEAIRGVVPQRYAYQTESSTVSFHPTLFIDITQQLEEKLGVLAEYASPEGGSTRSDPGLTVATARYWGSFSGHPQAEPLELAGSDGKGSALPGHPLVRSGRNNDLTHDDRDGA